MTIPDESTFELDPPRRPGLPDVGGAALVDDDPPPDPDTMPSARMLNMLQRLSRAYGALMPLAIVTIEKTLLAPPTIANVRGLNPNLTVDNFGITINDTGDYTLDWDTGILPVDGQPHVDVISDVLAIPRAWRVAEQIFIKLDDGTGSGVDASIQVFIY